MRPKRSVKVRQFRHLPKSLYEYFIMSPCYEWDYKGLHCVIWHNIMMGVVDYNGEEYPFRVKHLWSSMAVELVTVGLEDDEAFEFGRLVRESLAYMFGYMNINYFNFEVVYDKII